MQDIRMLTTEETYAVSGGGPRNGTGGGTGGGNGDGSGQGDGLGWLRHLGQDIVEGVSNFIHRFF